MVRDPIYSSNESMVMEETKDKKTATVSAGVFGLLAFFLGEFGIHDYAMGWWIQGCGHLAAVLVGLALLVISVRSPLEPTLIVGSWVIAIIELIYYKNRDAWQKADRKKDYLVIAGVTEVLIGLLIIVAGFLLYFLIDSKSCYASGYSGAGWAIVIIVLISIIPFVLTLVYIFYASSLRKKLSKEQLADKRVVRNIFTIRCLSAILGIILLVTAVAWFIR